MSDDGWHDTRIRVPPEIEAELAEQARKDGILDWDADVVFTEPVGRTMTIEEIHQGLAETRTPEQRAELDDWIDRTMDAAGIPRAPVVPLHPSGEPRYETPPRDVGPLGTLPPGIAELHEREYGCRSGDCDWRGPIQSLESRDRNRNAGGSIIGLHCPACGRWVRDL